MHELAGSKQPMVYDAQELYRWLVDLAIVKLLEGHDIKKAGFVTAENYHTRLLESTAGPLIDYIKNFITTAEGTGH